MPLSKELQFSACWKLSRAAYGRLSADGPECQTVILLAAMGLEALMNDLEFVAGDFRDDFCETLTTVLRRAEEERTTLLMKLELVHLVMTGRMLDRGCQPFQDLDLLISLRNLLVHARPETVSYGVVPAGVEMPRIVRSFASRGVIPLPGEDAPHGWRRYVVVRPVAAWAYNTAIALPPWLAGLCPDADIRMLLELFVRDLQPVCA